MIGHLQRNKVRQVLDKVELIHSVDSLRLARDIDRIGEEMGLCPKILIEVNVAKEASKYGITAVSYTHLGFETLSHGEALHDQSLLDNGGEGSPVAGDAQRSQRELGLGGSGDVAGHILIIDIRRDPGSHIGAGSDGAGGAVTKTRVNQRSPAQKNVKMIVASGQAYVFFGVGEVAGTDVYKRQRYAFCERLTDSRVIFTRS